MSVSDDPTEIAPRDLELVVIDVRTRTMRRMSPWDAVLAGKTTWELHGEELRPVR